MLFEIKCSKCHEPVVPYQETIVGRVFSQGTQYWVVCKNNHKMTVRMYDKLGHLYVEVAE